MIYKRDGELRDLYLESFMINYKFIFYCHSSWALCYPIIRHEVNKLSKITLNYCVLSLFSLSENDTRLIHITTVLHIFVLIVNIILLIVVFLSGSRCCSITCCWQLLMSIPQLLPLIVQLFH